LPIEKKKKGESNQSSNFAVFCAMLTITMDFKAPVAAVDGRSIEFVAPNKSPLR
jgi:hypothetical protein